MDSGKVRMDVGAVSDLCAILGDALGACFGGNPLGLRKDVIGAWGYFLLFVSNSSPAAIGCHHPFVRSEGTTDHFLLTNLFHLFFVDLGTAVILESQLFRITGTAVYQSK